MVKRFGQDRHVAYSRRYPPTQRLSGRTCENTDLAMRKIVAMLFEAGEPRQMGRDMLAQSLNQQAVILELMSGGRETEQAEVGGETGHIGIGLGPHAAVAGR